MAAAVENDPIKSRFKKRGPAFLNTQKRGPSFSSYIIYRKREVLQGIYNFF